MRKSTLFISAISALILLFSITVDAQDNELQKWVIGSGGTVMSGNTGGSQLSGMLGQTAIHTRASGNTIHQGFWVLYTPTGVGIDDNPVTMSSDLLNYPNPFSNQTTIKYTLPGPGFVTIRIYDNVGRLRNTLVNATQSGGEHEVMWDGKDENGYDCSSGSYIYELNVNSYKAANSGQYDEINLRNIMVIVR
jgi:hypothetical protein